MATQNCQGKIVCCLLLHVSTIDRPRQEQNVLWTAFLLIIFGNRKRWNSGIVNGMQNFFGMGRTGRVFHLFHLFYSREWNSWKRRNSWNSGDRFGWTLDFYSGIEWFLFHLNWNRWSLEYLFQVFLFQRSLKRNGTLDSAPCSFASSPSYFVPPVALFFESIRDVTVRLKTINLNQTYIWLLHTCWKALVQVLTTNNALSKMWKMDSSKRKCAQSTTVNGTFGERKTEIWWSSRYNSITCHSK